MTAVVTTLVPMVAIQPEEKASEGFGGKENIRRWFPL